MASAGIQFELISYRGLLKSFSEIATGNVMKKNNNEKNTHILNTLKTLFVISLCFIEKVLYTWMKYYDEFVYAPFKLIVLPWLELVPRNLSLGNGRLVLTVNASVFTLSRTGLFIPIAWLLKYNHNTLACITVLSHSFLGHVDGIVYKLHKDLYPKRDNPLLTNFLIAFCNKIVNILTLLVIFQAANFTNVSYAEYTIYCLIFYAAIAYDSLITIIRVHDYFETKFKFDKEQAACDQISRTSKEVKLKRKLESIGIAALCLSLDKSFDNPIMNFWGLLGMFCLFLTVRMAHKCLILEYNMIEENEILSRSNSLQPIIEVENEIESEESLRLSSDSESNLSDLVAQHQMLDTRVDKVYTIGCFDLFHFGHVKLLENMRKLGRQLIVGVHDSRSIAKLKNRVPIDSTEKRLLNVKKFADIVYCIAGTDPSMFIKCIVYIKPGERALYVRGDDMPSFPARDIVEQLMPIEFLPYTQSVSSTQIRKEKYSHVRADDEDYLSRNE